MTARVAGTPDHNRGIARKMRLSVTSSPVNTLVSGLQLTTGQNGGSGGGGGDYLKFLIRL
jgi:hypothetical protein